jgi:5S rRNA maturation endonuclease (ribonuclease M5)
MLEKSAKLYHVIPHTRNTKEYLIVVVLLLYMAYDEELIEQIKNLKAETRPIIVEGKKDKEALEALGVNAPIITLTGNPMYNIVEDIAREHKECVTLVDLDREGKQLFGKLNSGLSRLGVRVDNKFREFLLKKTKLRQIEGLVRYLDNQIP